MDCQLRTLQVALVESSNDKFIKEACKVVEIDNGIHGRHYRQVVLAMNTIIWHSAGAGTV
jgi:hypothetical protein